MPTEPHRLDLNVLIALAWPQHVHHERAHAWFATSTSTWMTTPITEAGFARLSTNPSVVTHRVSMNDALAMLVAMLVTLDRGIEQMLTPRVREHVFVVPSHIEGGPRQAG
jgi:predicted nucleic acid-binding protein